MTSSLSKIPDLNNISQSTSVQERGLVHRGRNSEEERSSLWISSWFRLLSVHEGQGKMGVGEDQKTCISIPVPGTKLWGVFCKQFHIFFSKLSPPFPHQLRVHCQNKGMLHTVHLCSLSTLVMMCIRHL